MSVSGKCIGRYSIDHYHSFARSTDIREWYSVETGTIVSASQNWNCQNAAREGCWILSFYVRMPSGCQDTKGQINGSRGWRQENTLTHQADAMQ
eukprot:3404454-Rhodomonas_salina.2